MLCQIVAVLTLLASANGEASDCLQRTLTDAWLSESISQCSVKTPRNALLQLQRSMITERIRCKAFQLRVLCVASRVGDECGDEAQDRFLQITATRDIDWSVDIPRTCLDSLVHGGREERGFIAHAEGMGKRQAALPLEGLASDARECMREYDEDVDEKGTDVAAKCTGDAVAAALKMGISITNVAEAKCKMMQYIVNCTVDEVADVCGREIRDEFMELVLASAAEQAEDLEETGISRACLEELKPGTGEQRGSGATWATGRLRFITRR